MNPNFALPNVTVNSSAFGSIASTVDVANGNPLGDGGPRLVQFAPTDLFSLESAVFGVESSVKFVNGLAPNLRTST